MTDKGFVAHHEDASKADKNELSLRQERIGSWELVEYSCPHRDDPSSIVYLVGKDATGVIMYTHLGYMSAQLQTPGQPPFQIDDFTSGSIEERIMASKNYVVYIGPFYLDESGDEPVVQHHMTISSFPNWLGNT